MRRSSARGPAPPPPAPARAPARARPAAACALPATLGALFFFGGLLMLRLSGATSAATAAARAWSSRGGGGGGGASAFAPAAGARPPPPGAANEAAAAPASAFTKSPLVPTTWRVVRRVDRDGGCFTQGLFFRGRELVESCGLHGQSGVRTVSLAGGAYRQTARADNPAGDFGEGAVQWPPAAEAEAAAALAAAGAAPPPPPPAGAAILQLTWQERAVVVWDAATLAPRARVPFASTSNEGWGLTSDGRATLVMSDGSSNLHFWAADVAAAVAGGAFAPERAPLPVVDRVRGGEGWAPPGPAPAGAGWAPRALVRPTRPGGVVAGVALGALNELEWAHGWVLANIWYDARVAIIHPRSGAVAWYLDFSPLLAENAGADCLNGLAYTMRLDVADADGAPPRAAPLGAAPWGGRLWVTGKLWTHAYEIELGGLVDAALLADLGDGAGTGVRRRAERG